VILRAIAVWHTVTALLGQYSLEYEKKHGIRAAMIDVILLLDIRKGIPVQRPCRLAT